MVGSLQVGVAHRSHDHCMLCSSVASGRWSIRCWCEVPVLPEITITLGGSVNCYNLLTGSMSALCIFVNICCGLVCARVLA